MTKYERPQLVDLGDDATGFGSCESGSTDHTSCRIGALANLTCDHGALAEIEVCVIGSSGGIL